MTSPDMGPGGSWEAPDGSRPWNTGDSSPDGLAFMAAADEEHWRETAFRQPFRDSYNPIGSWSNGISGLFGAIIGGIFNGWFGGGSVGEPQEVQYTIEAIKDVIINGYNVETKVVSGTWTKPENVTEIVVIAVGGGRTGGDGSTTTGGSGGQGGGGGGYIAQALEVSSVPDTVPYTIGQSNQATTFGSLVSVDGGAGGISSQFGFTETTSVPGRGGNGTAGGAGSGTAGGERGQSSALGAGGAGGSGAASGGSGGNGSPGGNVSAASVTKCGGGGGGGGAGGSNAGPGATTTGGSGGPGGYPGGGGGGGGGRGSQSLGGSSNAGAGGIGATGIIWIFWR